ncbi:MAG: hypothetical protein CMJ75_21705 [Planctomycetaceae bacterium]|nr:hypothetical protein [Planctomycetaceae bacterium]
MASTADVIVVGGGVTGLTAALQLRERGVREVLVLERHTVGAGQSGRAAGVVRGTVRHDVVSQMQLEGQEFLGNFTEKYGIPLDVHRVGYLLVASREHRSYVQATRAVASRAGCNVREIDEATALTLQPGLADSPSAIYLHEPGGVYVDPMPATHAILLAARQAGVRVIDDCPVRTLRTEKGKIRGVDTESERYSAPVVFLATSVWAQPLLATMGWELPVRPHVAEMAFFHVPASSDFRLNCVLFDSRVGLYMRPEEQRLLFVGRRESDYYGTDKDLVDPDCYRQTATHSAIKEMHVRLGTALPPMHAGFVHRTYACTYDVTPDEMPILDRFCGTEGLYFALGFSGGGFSSAPWIAKRMAAWMDLGVSPPEIEMFRAARFNTGQLIRWANTPADEMGGAAPDG